MKKLLLLFILILPTVKAGLIIESFQLPSSVQEGDTFETSILLRNTGSGTIGTDLSPIIATLSSAENCIINSAKIVGVLDSGELKDVSWIVTAPTVGGCQLAVSVSASETYASESRNVIVSPSQENFSSSSQSSGGSGGSGSGGAAGGVGGGAGREGAPATTLEPGSVPEESGAVEEIPITTTTLIGVSDKVSVIQDSSYDFFILFLFYFLISISIGAAIFIILLFRKWNIQTGISKKKK